MSFPKGMASRVDRRWMFLFLVSVLLMSIPSILATDYYEKESEIPVLIIALILIGTIATTLVLLVPFLLAISDQQKNIIIRQKT